MDSDKTIEKLVNVVDNLRYIFSLHYKYFRNIYKIRESISFRYKQMISVANVQW